MKRRANPADLHNLQMDTLGVLSRRDGSSAPVYTFDTNVMLGIARNPNFVSMLKVRLNMEGAVVRLDDTVRAELENHGCPVERVVALARRDLKAVISGGRAPPGLAERATSLEEKHPTLHSPDSYILAGCIAENTILVSRDRGLIRAAKESGVHVVNPDTLATP